MNKQNRHINLPFPNTEDTDYKAEMIAALLTEQGYEPESIVIQREGMARRGFAKEVENISTELSAKDWNEYICIKANKESLYDMLPEGLFHQPVSRKRGNKTKEDILEEIRIHRNEEFFARKFFHIYEQLADTTLTKAYSLGLKYDRKISHPEFTRLFRKHWDILQWLDNRQSIFFIYLIPVLHKIRMHYSQIQEAFSIILEAPVKIKEITLTDKKTDSLFESALGENELGVNLVLGNRFDDGEKDLEVNIGPITTEKYKDFAEGSKGAQILDKLCETILPASTFVSRNFIINQAESVSILSDKSPVTFLGINSFI